MVALGIFPAFTRHRTRPNAIHGDVQCFVRLGRQGAERHAGCDKTLTDFVDTFNVLDSDFGRFRLPAQKVARRGWRLLRHFGDEVGIGLEGLVIAARRGILQQVDELRLVVMGLAGGAHLVEATD